MNRDMCIKQSATNYMKLFNVKLCVFPNYFLSKQNQIIFIQKKNFEFQHRNFDNDFVNNANFYAAVRRNR